MPSFRIPGCSRTEDVRRRSYGYRPQWGRICLVGGGSVAAFSTRFHSKNTHFSPQHTCFAYVKKGPVAEISPDLLSDAAARRWQTAILRCPELLVELAAEDCPSTVGTCRRSVRSGSSAVTSAKTDARAREQVHRGRQDTPVPGTAGWASAHDARTAGRSDSFPHWKGFPLPSKTAFLPLRETHFLQYEKCDCCSSIMLVINELQTHFA